jgi:hypothetical protein
MPTLWSCETCSPLSLVREPTTNNTTRDGGSATAGRAEGECDARANAVPSTAAPTSRSSSA